MLPSWFDFLETAWSSLRALPDAIIIMDMFLALVFGFLFGYERSYHGRAAGMRTYGIVCMVAAALTSASMHLGNSLGGQIAGTGVFIDPTRTIQGIVTGVGFLGAGIIMKDGLKISGLTTSASVWASAAIGILVGLGFYVGGLGMTMLAIGFILLGPKFDKLLPSRRPIFVSLQFKKGVTPKDGMVHKITHSNGYDIAKNSISIKSRDGQVEWGFVAVDINRHHSVAIADLADVLSLIEGLESFHISRARN